MMHDVAGLGTDDQKSAALFTHTQPRPSQPPSKSLLATEKWALELPAGDS
jgi:hypothetical protein